MSSRFTEYYYKNIEKIKAKQRLRYQLLSKEERKQQYQLKKEKHKQYYAINKDKITIKKKRYYAINKEKIKELNKYNSKLRLYGLTKDQYDRLIKRGCGICKEHWKLCIDHNHSTGKVRGVLCNSCNLGIAHLKESTKLLASATRYLKRKELF